MTTALNEASQKAPQDGPSATELLFIRHGETDWNREQRFQGHVDVPLNGHGRTQAQRLAARLADQPFEQLFSSDLLRAQQTAEPLAAAWGLPLQTVPQLREQHFGVFEGLDVGTLSSLHGELWAGWLRQRADEAPPGGETRRDFSARVLGAVQALAAEQRGRRVAVVTHGGVLDMLWRHLHALSLDGARACAIPNTGINRLRWEQGVLHLQLWADDAHVGDALSPTAPR